MKSKLLERLSKEKPKHSQDSEFAKDFCEAVHQGYSLEQIMKILCPIDERNGYIEYSMRTSFGTTHDLKMPYTFENIMLIREIILGKK